MAAFWAVTKLRKMFLRRSLTQSKRFALMHARHAGGAAHPHPMPSYVFPPQRNKPLHEDDDLIWEDGTGGIMAIDRLQPKLSDWDSFVHFMGGVAFFVSIPVFYWLFVDPYTEQLFPDHILDLDVERGRKDPPEGWGDQLNC